MYHCETCHELTSSSKSLVNRTKEAFNRGAHIGHFIFIPRFCRSCKTDNFFRLLRTLDNSYPEIPIPISETEYYGASVTGGKIRIGSTVSEYTKRISRGI